MKKIFLLIVGFSLTIILIGQEIKISVAPTINDAFYYQFVAYDTENVIDRQSGV